MDPAYHIPLSANDLRLIGELVVIMGQVEEEMILCATGLLNINREAANLVMGSTKIADVAAIWAALIRQRHPSAHVLSLLPHISSELEAVQSRRNDFMHGFFEAGPLRVFNVDHEGRRVHKWMGSAVTVRRTKRRQQSPITDLQELRDRAARLSCLVAHVGECMDPLRRNVAPERSPWHERLAPSLHEALATPSTRKAKAQKAQRKPSPGK